MRRPSFLPLLATNLLGVANDNFLKTFASFTLLGWIADGRTRMVAMGVTAASLVLPYILFSPLADRLTCLLEKVSVVRWAKLLELPIVWFAIGGFCLHSVHQVVCAIVLMGLQSALYSPAKYALVRDIGGVERVSSGMGLMEGVSFAGVLGGTVAASFLADGFDPRAGYAVLACLALAGFGASFAIRAHEELDRELHAVNPVRFFRRARRMAGRYDGLGDAISALCVFWATAAMLQQGLLVYGTEVLHAGSAATGGLLVAAAVGIVAGQVAAGYIDGRRPLLPLVPVFGLAAAALLAVLYLVPLGTVAFGLVLAALAVTLGFFKLPLDAAIQRTVAGPRLNTVLAYFNQVTFLWMFGASAVYAAVGWFLGPRAFLNLLSLAMAYAALRFCFRNRAAMLRTGEALFSGRYRVAADPLPAGRTLLVLPNHPALVDPLLVLTAYRATPLRPLVDGAFFADPLFRRVLGTLRAVPVPDLRARHAAADVERVRGLKDAVLAALRAGESVVLYPSGHIYTENREDIGNRRLAHEVCRELPPGVTVVGLRTTGLWGSVWSRKGRASSPSFALTLVLGAFLWPFALLLPRRRVRICAEDLTRRVRTWSQDPRRVFNFRLADWYNSGPGGGVL